MYDTNTDKYSRFLIVSDVHGLVKEFTQFLALMQKKYNDTIRYCVQLGDFFKGRNVIRNKKTYSFWKDTSIFKEFPFPIFSVKGNEDINIPESWWSGGMLSLLPNLTEFQLDRFNSIPLHYFEEDGEKIRELGVGKLIRLNMPRKRHKDEYYPMFNCTYEKNSPIAPILESDRPVDFMLSHVPPYGLLDRTRDAITHKHIRNTGSKLLRLIIDKRHPQVIFFGHNHYCNYKFFGEMLVISVDKFCRKMPYEFSSTNEYSTITKKVDSEEEVNGFSYCVVTEKEESYLIEIYRRNQLVFQYDMLQQNILYSAF
ncbi:MAG: metallophosphoesterase [Candidatus Lokiarchaeota archaeon]|nr:metallophosphoesterase [Candidatus Lokiarchaeota archaeon]